MPSYSFKTVFMIIVTTILCWSARPGTVQAALNPHDTCQWQRISWPVDLTPLLQARPCRMHGRSGLCLLSNHKAGFVSFPDRGIVTFPEGFSGEGKDIVSDPDGRRLWVLSTTGLWMWDGRTWKRVWVPSDSIGVLNRMAFINGDIWVGTDRGLWIQKNKKVFVPFNGPWRETDVYDFARTAQGIWILTGDTLHLLQPKSRNQPAVILQFSAHLDTQEDDAVEADGETDTASSDTTAATQRQQPRLLIAPDPEGHDASLAVVASNGLFVRAGNRRGFRQFPLWTDRGRISGVFLNQALIIAMGSTFWVMAGDESVTWRRLSKAPRLTDAVALASDGEHLITVGPFDAWMIEKPCLVGSAALSSTDDSDPCPAGDFHGPSLRQVQEWVIEEADVSQQTIRRWRTQARHRAWLPALDVSLDRNIGDLWHWDSGSSPDVLLKGEDAVEWRVGLSWDLGDLVFNDDVIDIETRSRLMVQLRQDLLDRSVRYYIEYKRLWAQWRTVCSTPSDSSRLNDLLLSLEETAGFLDALTAGRFSEALDAAQQREREILDHEKHDQ